MRKLPRLPEFTRFGVVTVAGLVVDLSIAWGLAVFLLVPLPVAAAVGFGCGALSNYLLHIAWTFRSPAATFSYKSMMLYVVSLVAVLAIRVSMVAVLSSVIGVSTGHELGVLLAATGISFVANYFLAKYVVFHARARDRVAPPNRA